MYKLFLDDERDPYKVKWVQLPLGPWTVVRTYNEFVKTITEKDLPEFVSFDHDLADEHYRPSMYNADKHYTNYYTDGTFKERTGYECAVWLVNYCIDKNLPFPQYVVHSMNPVGKENIISYIESYKKHQNT
jgi:hypothetical protein